MPGLGIGVREARGWMQTLTPGSVLDLGCGPGYPITSFQVDAGFHVYGVDASPSMLARLRSRLPTVSLECSSVEHSAFLDRSFDAVIAWGLLVLLARAVQRRIIEKIGRVLVPEGRFLFTAPAEASTWLDAMTGRRSESLGAEAHERLLTAAGLRLLATTEDEGGSHYFMSTKD